MTSSQIAKPTERYAVILNCIPPVYVAPEGAVSQLVQFMAAEIAAAFRASGTVLPPWRHVSSMLRWGAGIACVLEQLIWLHPHDASLLCAQQVAAPQEPGRAG